MRWWLLVVVTGLGPAVGSAEPPPYAAFVETGRTWTYDLTRTAFDMEGWGSASRPPRKTERAVVTCSVTKVALVTGGVASRIDCDGALDPPIAGDYAVTTDGLSRNGALLLPAKPKAMKKLHGGVRAGRGGWCLFDDTTDFDPDGATSEQCLGATGFASGDFDGGGGDWRRTSYRLRTTRVARTAGTP